MKIKTISIVIIFSAFLLSANQKSTFKVDGMMCETGCAWRVTSVVKSITGINMAEVDFDNKILIVEYDNDKTSDEKIISILTDKTTYVFEKIDKSKNMIPINWFKKIIDS